MEQTKIMCEDYLNLDRLDHVFPEDDDRPWAKDIRSILIMFMQEWNEKPAVAARNALETARKIEHKQTDAASGQQPYQAFMARF